MQRADAIQGRLARQVLEGGCGIDKSPVEEDPPAQATRSHSIGQRHGHCPASEGRPVNPG
jgi:hypothetical protein